MKKMLDLIKEVTRLKEFEAEQEEGKIHSVNYLNGQIQIIDYLIEESILPEDLFEVISAMYTASFEQFKEITNETPDADRIKIETLGATDIIAWILEIPEESHVKKKEENSMLV